jgi:hypothetical protein
MAVEKTERDIRTLITNVSSGEIRLPEIQRGYVWKPTQVAKLVESIYRGYPSGSLLFWRTEDSPETRDVAANAPTIAPAVAPLYLLDGQQRLTSLHRVLHDHDDAQIVFNVERELFQNQSAATRRDPKWIKVFDLLREDVDLFEVRGQLLELGLGIPSQVIGQRLNRVAAIPNYGYHMEIITALPYEEVAQIFVRVNSGGRSLRTTDLALATLSARWPGIVRKVEDEAGAWRAKGFGGLDQTFLTRALTGAVLGRGLSAWSHARLAGASDEELEKGWATVRRGLAHLVPLLQNNLKVSHSSLLPSVNVLLPLVVLLGERPDEPMDAETAKGILYWFLVATVRNRYSSSADTLLGQDIPAAREPDPVKALLSNLGVVGARIEVAESALAGRTVASPYFFLSFLVAQDSGAKDWWFGTNIAVGGDGGRKLQYHHVHPQATLRKHYPKAEINDLANLAFISAKANQKISKRSPADYFPELGSEELRAHRIPTDLALRTADQYRRFLRERRRLLAEAMTELLSHYRPSWLDATGPVLADDLDGCALDLALHGDSWEEQALLVTARVPGIEWRAVVALSTLERVIGEAAAGIDTDFAIGSDTVAVRAVGDEIEIPFGPLLVVGSAEEWKSVLDRERAEPAALAELIGVIDDGPVAEARRFPVTSSD